MTQHIKSWLCVSACLLIGGCSILAPKPETKPIRHGLDYTYAEGSPEHWRKMHSSLPEQPLFLKDPHVWVVTPEFAKAEGFPLEWASNELKGVAAVAWSMQPHDDQCGWGGRSKLCTKDMMCRLDLYFDRQLHPLPWAPKRPMADFYWQEISTAWHLLPSIGFAKEANGDVGRSTMTSPNYPDLGVQPFADPKTGEELEWNSDVVVYDRELHPRYVFVRLSLGCYGALGAEPHTTRTFYLETRDSYKKRRTDMGRSYERPDLAQFVHHTISMPASWDRRIGPFRKAYVERSTDFYKKTWNVINK